MATLIIIFTFVTLLGTIAGVGWGGVLFYRRLAFLEDDCRRMKLTSVEDSQQVDKWILEISGRIEALERRASDSTQHAARSLNYTQRSQMLRMIRRGDSADQVSSTLGVPLSQVRLLMKLPAANTGGGGAKAQSAGQ